MSRLTLPFMILSIIIPLLFISSCKNYDSIPFKIMMDSTLKSLINNNDDINVYNILYSFNYVNDQKILIEGSDNEYKVYNFNYSTGKIKKLFSFEICEDEYIGPIKFLDEKLSVYTNIKHDFNISFLRRTYDIKHEKILSQEVLLTTADTQSIHIEDFEDIFRAKTTQTKYGQQNHFKLPDNIKHDPYVIYKHKYIFDDSSNIKGIALFGTIRNKLNFFLYRQFDDNLETDYFHLLNNKDQPFRYHEFLNYSTHGKDQQMLYSYTKLDNDKYGISMKFFKEGKVTEKIYELSHDILTLNGEIYYRIYDCKFIDNKIIFVIYYLECPFLKITYELKGLAVQIFDITEQNITKQNIIVFNDELLDSLDYRKSIIPNFTDFDIDKLGNLYFLFDETELIMVSSVENQHLYQIWKAFYSSINLLAIDNNLQPKWLKEISDRYFHASPHPEFPVYHRKLGRQCFPYLSTGDNELALKYVSTIPKYGIYEEIYSKESGKIIRTKELFIPGED